MEGGGGGGGGGGGEGGGGGFMGELIPQLFYQNYLPISASFGVKRVLWYALYNIPSY